MLKSFYKAFIALIFVSLWRALMLFLPMEVMVKHDKLWIADGIYVFP